MAEENEQKKFIKPKYPNFFKEIAGNELLFAPYYSQEFNYNAVEQDIDKEKENNLD